jgi:hypothetical protein
MHLELGGVLQIHSVGVTTPVFARAVLRQGLNSTPVRWDPLQSAPSFNLVSGKTVHQVCASFAVRCLNTLPFGSTFLDKVMTCFGFLIDC